MCRAGVCVCVCVEQVCVCGLLPAVSPVSPGQVAVLLHMRVSLRAPLHRVPYGDDTQERVRTCQP